MLKIYANPMSSSSTKVLFTAELLNVNYQMQHMDWKKDLKKPAYKKLHPAGKVPAISDNDHVLFESQAIMRYLCDKHDKKGRLYPKSLKQRSIVDQWMDFASLHVGTSIGKVAWNRVWAPMMKMPVDQQSLKDGLSWLDRFLPIINNQLKDNKFLAGNTLTLADLSLLSYMDYTKPAKISLKKYKHLETWYNKLQQQRFWKKVHENAAG